ncbi:MAG TPA: IDEAL domain-containing protein [Bacillaceae bacterium]
MEKKKSYNELLKEYTMTQLQNETLAAERHVELLLNALLLKRQEERLREEIDRSLDRKDKEAFMKLCRELESLIKD